MEYQENQGDSDWEFDEDDENDELFTRATQHVQKIHDKLLPNDLLELYGLYKQATVGNCNTEKPGVFSMQARAKWCAWNDLKDMPVEVAKQSYADKVRRLDPAWYENVQKGSNKPAGGTGWVVHSVELPPNDHHIKPENEKNIFDFVRDGNIQRVKELLQASDFQVLDGNGMGLIHWATDSNNKDVLEFILSSGCSVDFRDAEQQTALHYASQCGHIECAKLLLQYGANKLNIDANGQTCLDVADDPQIRILLE